MNMETDSRLSLFADLDLSRGFQLFIKSANHGYCAAMVNLGNCLFGGKGTAQNQSEALKWYRKAAEQGFVVAQCNLGGCYENGEGVSMDKAEALKWFGKAAEKGDSTAKSRIRKIEKELAKNEKNREDSANRGDDIVSVRSSWSAPVYYMGVEHPSRQSFVYEMTRGEYLALLSSGQYGIATYMKGRFGYDYDDPSIELLSFN